jgi:hypothetical protein
MASESIIAAIDTEIAKVERREQSQTLTDWKI